ncbi:hypothetical protein BURMUCGD1_1606 [Burkholderia multivorans CGD1]|nr:hypothetical protein BURMUCGD1_1606 [Burkholderia multivorans CGD1]
MPPRTGLHRQKRDSTVFDSAFHRQAGRRFAQADDSARGRFGR